MEESDDVGAILYYIIDAVESVMDGTSGAIHVIFLNALSSSLRSQAEPIGLNLTEGMWSKALESSLQTLGRYTPAQIGDRTIIDALQPFVESLAAGRGLKEATEEAKAGADRTKGMKPKFGRAVYVGGEQWKEVPDPGAYGLSQFLLGIAGL